MSNNLLPGLEGHVTENAKVKLLLSQNQELKKFFESQKLNFDEGVSRIVIDFVTNSRFIREFRKQIAG